MGVCELPVNTLLYLYLRRMAESLAIPRAAAALNVYAWLIPLVILLNLCIIPIAAIEDAQQELVWGVFIAAVGAVSLICGVIATMAVARLIIATAHTGMQQWLAGSQRAIIRTLIASRKLLTSPLSASVYRTVAGGIVLWLATIPWTSAEVLERGGRHASGGDVPYINLPAPKIVIATPAITQWQIYSASHSLLPYLLQALAVWMMTIHPGAGEPRRNRWLRITTRLLATLAPGRSGGRSGRRRDIRATYTC